MKHFHNIKGVFFDLDGTLFETAPELVAAAQKMLQKLGLQTVSPNVIESFIGKGAENLVRKSIELSASGTSDRYLKLGMDLFYKFYDEIADQSKAYDGALDAVMQLNQKGLKLACVTNKPKHFTHKILKEHKMDQLLDFVVSGDEVEKKKPDPMPIHMTCHTLQIKPIESIMVGDSCHDIDAGYNAGTFVVTVPYGYQSGQSIKSNKVDLAVNNLTDLLTVIN